MGNAYTEEETAYIVSEYLADPCRATVDRLAEELQVPGGARSIIAKLSAMKDIYKSSKVRLNKLGEPVIKRVEMLKAIGDMFGIELTSLANKQDLLKLYKALRDPVQVKAWLVDLEYELSEKDNDSTV